MCLISNSEILRVISKMQRLIALLHTEDFFALICDRETNTILKHHCA